jgi:hypothetical protein
MTSLAEKGGSRTLREPYDSQTGFEDTGEWRCARRELESGFRKAPINGQ